jgi:hypothetical protein
MFPPIYRPVPRLPSAAARHPRPASGTARTTRYPAVVGRNYDLDRERRQVWKGLLLLWATFTLIIVARLIYSAWYLG